MDQRPLRERAAQAERLAQEMTDQITRGRLFEMAAELTAQAVAEEKLLLSSPET